MNEVTTASRLPLGIRLLGAISKDPDWSAMTTADLVAFRNATNRTRSSRPARVITGRPDRGATIDWQQVRLPGRVVRIRVYRPTRANGATLPLVLHVHGGGFVGTAVQSDWINSHLAVRLPATIVSVEHRLLDPETPMTAAIDDVHDVLRRIAAEPSRLRVDPARVALFGESAGGMMAAITALRIRETDLIPRAQVLVNPTTDLTETMLEYESLKRNGDSPTLTIAQLRMFHRLAVPRGTDARAISPLRVDDLGGLPPALVVIPALDPIADHGRRLAERLREHGTPARLTEHPGAPHAFLSMPGLVPRTKVARAEITAFLHEHLAC